MLVIWHVHDVMYIYGVARFCIALRTRLVMNDGNSSMDSFQCRCVKDWPLSMASDTSMLSACALSGAINLLPLSTTTSGCMLGPHSQNFSQTFRTDNLGIPKNFSYPFYWWLSLHFERSSSFLTSVKLDQPISCAYTDHVRKHPQFLEKNLWKTSYRGMSTEYTIYKPLLFKLTKRKFALLTGCRFNSSAIYIIYDVTYDV